MLLNEDSVKGTGFYDEATISILEARKDAMIQGKVKTFSHEQAIDNLQQFRKQYEI